MIVILTSSPRLRSVRLFIEGHLEKFYPKFIELCREMPYTLFQNGGQFIILFSAFN